MWYNKVFTERELKEISFCKQYAMQYAHGTSGHHRMMIIAKLSMMLDVLDFKAARDIALRAMECHAKTE